MTQAADRIETARTHVNEADSALQSIDRLLITAEKAVQAADRARSAARSNNVLLLGGMVALSALIFVHGRRHH